MMEEILNDLERKYINFKLGEEQRQVLLQIFNFISNDRSNTQCTLDGFGGSGKTTITTLIIQYLKLKNIKYVLSAPTHKAKNVLSSYTNENVSTIHQLLTLKPIIDIMELDYRNLLFSSTALDDEIPKNGLLIVDECSMINAFLFDYINTKCLAKNTKIIWVGKLHKLPTINRLNCWKILKFIKLQQN